MAPNYPIKGKRLASVLKDFEKFCNDRKIYIWRGDFVQQDPNVTYTWKASK